MAKITRKIAKIFGSSAGVNQIGQFGSLAAGSIAYSTDPTVIQALSNYLTGWFGAVVGSNSPAIEDMNALCYLYAYQIAYLMQEGIAEWETGTTYYIGSLVSDGSGVQYVSLTDTNQGNALTDRTKWFTPTFNGLMFAQTVDSTMTLPSGKTMMTSQMAIGSGKTVTVPSGARVASEGSIVVSGTGVLVATGTGVIRAF